MTKSLIDGGMKPDECSDGDAACALAQGHPKSKPVPVGFGMKNRTQDGDGPDDDARSPNFERGGS